MDYRNRNRQGRIERVNERKSGGKKEWRKEKRKKKIGEERKSRGKK